MRKETEEIMAAFLRGESKTMPRTVTDGQCVKLHGNTIIERHEKGYTLTLANWPTNTTRERLNGFLSLAGYSQRFSQKNNKQFFDNTLIGDNQTIFLER